MTFRGRYSAIINRIVATEANQTCLCIILRTRKSHCPRREEASVNHRSIADTMQYGKPGGTRSDDFSVRIDLLLGNLLKLIASVVKKITFGGIILVRLHI